MHSFFRIPTIVATIAALLIGFAPSAAPAALDINVSIGAPPPPIYEQPPCVVENTLWLPGYWAWGEAGYYWVPGFWAQAPQPGYLWTPGYWGWNQGYYAWHPGYWGQHVGFYGGVNYGYGYFGSGFYGGAWNNGYFRYNTAVVNVNPTYVHNVYVNRTVYINHTVVNNYHTTYYDNRTINRVSYNGGPSGIAVQPNQSEARAEQEYHLRETLVQRQNRIVAAQNRNYLAAINHGVPPVAGVPRPLGTRYHPAGFAPIRPEDRIQARHAYPIDVRTQPVTSVHMAPERLPAAELQRETPLRPPERLITQPQPLGESRRPVNADQQPPVLHESPQQHLQRTQRPQGMPVAPDRPQFQHRPRVQHVQHAPREQHEMHAEGHRHE